MDSIVFLCPSGSLEYALSLFMSLSISNAFFARIDLFDPSPNRTAEAIIGVLKGVGKKCDNEYNPNPAVL